MTPEPSLGAWLGLAALSGLVALDDTSWPQAMVSRPFVAATLGGWLAANAAVGLAVGALLEVLLLPHQPLGGARCPDPGPASLVAGAAGAGAASSGAVALPVLLAVLVGWGLAWAGEVTVRWQRGLAARLFGDAASEARRPEAVERRLFASAAADFVRGALLGAVWWVPAALVVRAGGAAVEGGTGLLLAAAAIGAGGAGVAGASAPRKVARVAAPAGAALAAVCAWWLA